MKFFKYNIFLITITLSITTLGLFFQQVSAYSADKDNSLNVENYGGFNDAVYYAVLQNDGKIILGGEFTTYNGVSANKIIRLHSDGTRDASFTIGSGFNDQIRAIAIQNDGKIVVGGFFTSYNGVAANRIIRLNTDGTRDISFTIGSGFNAQVRAITIQNDGKIIVGGAITNYNGATIHRIIRLNSNGPIDTSFDVGTGRNNNVRSIVIQSDGKIILGGGFTISSGVTTNRIVRLHSDGTKDNSFTIGSGFNEQVNYVHMTADEKFIVGGLFTGYNGITANRIIRLNNDGTRDLSFDTGNGFNNDVRNIKIQSDGKILIGGAFTGYKGVAANNIINLNSDGTRDTSFDIGEGFDAAIHALVIQRDDKIIVGGDFTSYKGIAGGHLARLHGNSIISLLNTSDTNKIYTEFTSKGYILSDSILAGSGPMVFIDSLGKVPVELKIKNDNIILTLPQNVEIKNKSDNTDYTGRFIPPTSIAASNIPNTISTISVGSIDKSLQLTNGFATLLVPVSDKNIGDFVQIHYSEDNGGTWHPQTNSTVISYNGEPYVEFTTDHFTDFAITEFTGSFTINNDAAETISSGVTLNISTTPEATNMRFSNDGSNRSPRENYSNSKARTLSPGYGTKTVYVQLDADGDDTYDLETSDTINYPDPNGLIDDSTGCTAGAECGDLTLKIIPGTSYCDYGKSLDFNSTGRTYGTRSLSTGFRTQLNNIPWFCEDNTGRDNRTLSIGASDLINITTNNPAHTIPASHIFIKNPEARRELGVCTSGPGDSIGQRIDIASSKTILEKVGYEGEGCKIVTDNVSLKVDLAAAQAIGQYSGTITINIPDF